MSAAAKSSIAVVAQKVWISATANRAAATSSIGLGFMRGVRGRARAAGSAARFGA